MLKSKKMQVALGELLGDYRVNANIHTVVEATKQLNLGTYTLYRIEDGTNLPSKRILVDLFDLYGIRHYDREVLLQKRLDVLKQRQKEKLDERE